MAKRRNGIFKSPLSERSELVFITSVSYAGWASSLADSLATQSVNLKHKRTAVFIEMEE